MPERTRAPAAAEETTSPETAAPTPGWSAGWSEPLAVAAQAGNRFLNETLGFGAAVTEDTPTPTPVPTPGLQPPTGTPTPAGPASPAPAGPTTATPASQQPAPGATPAAPALTPEQQKAQADQARIDAALGVVKEQMSTGLFDWAVTDGEAKTALSALNALPPELQGRAVTAMDPGSFDKLLSNVPTLDKAGFQQLFENTTDPERKLKLWAQYHEGQVASDAAREREKTADDGGWWPFDDTAEQKENARLNRRRDEIVDATGDEIQDEVKFAMDQLAKGKLTEQGVKDLAARKQKEHELEMTYNVNLVNDEGARKSDGSKIAWAPGELTQIENALARMPEEHVKHNAMLKEIRRSEIAVRGGKDVANIGGDHGDGVIRVYDTGITGGYRHTGDVPESVDPAKSQGTPLKPLEEVIVHEVGHDIHDQETAAFEKFKGSAGWQTGQSDDALRAAGVSEADRKALLDGTKDSVVVDGKVYRKDSYQDGKFTSFDEHAIPSPATGSQPNQRSGGDTWNYARTDPKEHFAETYQKAIHMPETLAKDLLDAPQSRVTTVTASRDAAQASLDRLSAQDPPATAAQLAAARQAVQVQTDLLADARRDQTAQQTQWDTMRNDVFHTDTATTDAVKRLKAEGVPAEKIAEFQRKAGRLQTPGQIAVLEAGY